MENIVTDEEGLESLFGRLLGMINHIIKIGETAVNAVRLI